jgi:D-sedoheptulose 7-phosphate isomerase
MNRIDEIYRNAADTEAFAAGYLGYLSQVLGSISKAEIAAFVDLLLDARSRNAKILFMGNGGSAATASHFANDIAIGTRTFESPFRALSLTDNSATISAIANDDGYEKIFLQQLQVLMEPGDLVIAISASGNSRNLVDAVEWANQSGGITVALTAFDGGILRGLAKYNVHVPTNRGEYGPAEDAHMVLDHLLAAYLTRFIREHKN